METKRDKEKEIDIERNNGNKVKGGVRASKKNRKK